LQKLSERYLNRERLIARGWFDPQEVERISRRLGQKRYHAEAAMRLWTMIVSEIWAQLYLDNRGAKPRTATR
jgi:hypothetical protein